MAPRRQIGRWRSIWSAGARTSTKYSDSSWREPHDPDAARNFRVALSALTMSESKGGRQLPSSPGENATECSQQEGQESPRHAADHLSTCGRTEARRAADFRLDRQGPWAKLAAPDHQASSNKGRIAQGESTCLTSRGSEVRNLLRPPSVSFCSEVSRKPVHRHSTGNPRKNLPYPQEKFHCPQVVLLPFADRNG